MCSSWSQHGSEIMALACRKQSDGSTRVASIDSSAHTCVTDLAQPQQTPGLEGASSSSPTSDRRLSPSHQPLKKRKLATTNTIRPTATAEEDEESKASNQIKIWDQELLRETVSFPPSNRGQQGPSDVTCHPTADQVLTLSFPHSLCLSHTRIRTYNSLDL